MQSVGGEAIELRRAVDSGMRRAEEEIECDPKVWSQVESLIRSRLPDETDRQGE